MLMPSSSSVDEEEWRRVAEIDLGSVSLCLTHSSHRKTLFAACSNQIHSLSHTPLTKSPFLLSNFPVRAMATPPASLHLLLDDDDSEPVIAIAAGSNVQIWRGKTELLAELPHREEVYSIAWAGDVLVTAAHTEVSVWVVDPPSLLPSPPASPLHVWRLPHNDRVLGVVVSPDGHLVVGFSSKRYRIWRTTSSSTADDDDDHHLVEESCLESTSGSISCAAITSTHVGFGLSDGTVFCHRVRLDGQSGGIMQGKRLFGHCANVRSLQMSARHRLAVSASYDRSLRIWDLEQGTPLRILDNVHDFNVTSAVFFGSDDSYIASVASDRKLKVFDLFHADRERMMRWLISNHQSRLPHLPEDVVKHVKLMLF